MKDINEVRERIDSIDNDLSRLFVERLKLAGEVAAYKKENGSAVFDPAREREILSRVTEAVGGDDENGARLFFSTLFAISKSKQRELLNGTSNIAKEIEASIASHADKFPSRAFVACSGTEGSYSQQAVSLMFAYPTIAFFNSFDKVFEAVEKGLCPYGILPIENSAAGSVAEVYDLMLKHKFHIARALRLKVEHVLLAPQGIGIEDITEIVSHPHALAQCKDFFASHPKVKPITASNTAVAAKELAASGLKNRAVIASRICAELYGLKVIAEGIQDAAFNYTRFICISKNLEIYPDADKFTIMLSLPHRPGSLYSLISKFASLNVNLTKLESRPIPGMDFEFRFTFDFEAMPSDKSVIRLISELANDPEIDHFDFLGAYAEK